MATLPGGIAGMFGGNIASGMAGVLPVLVMVCVLVAIVAFFLYWKRYDVDVEIFSPRGNNTVHIMKDRGGFIKTKGGTEFRLLKQKASVPALTLAHVISSGRKNYLKLYELDKGELLPVDIRVDRDKVTIVPEEGDIKEYRKQRFMKNKQQWEQVSNLERLMPVLTIAVPAVLLIVLFYLVLKDLGTISQHLGTAAKTVAGACSGGGPL